MTTTISEKDKKLLIKLVIGLAIFGLVYLIIRPLYEQNTSLAEEIQRESYLQNDYKLKITTLPAMMMVTQEDEETLTNASKQFFPVMTSTQIDDVITSQVMSYGLVARDLGINMMKEGNTTLNSYVMVPEEERVEGGPYTGLTTAGITLSVTGDQGNLQRFLDANINAGAKQRVISYLWSRQRDGEYGLSITMELYMCEDVEEYLTRETATEE